MVGKRGSPDGAVGSGVCGISFRSFSIALFIVQRVHLLHHSVGISFSFGTVVVDYRLFSQFRVEL